MKLFKPSNFAFGTSVSFILLSLILWFWEDNNSVNGAYRRNGEIFNIGWIWSLPYDIGNTLRAPLAGPLSLILTAGLCIIMFFGMVVSPVYYLLGTPPRKYHPNDAIQTLPFPVRKARNFLLDYYNHSLVDSVEIGDGDYTDFNDTRNWNTNQETSENSVNHLNFLNGAFFFIPENDDNCRKLILCHSHGFLSFLPNYFLRIYQVFSKKMLAIPNDYQAAIQAGLEDQGNCKITYGDCKRDVATISQHTILKMILGDSINYDYFSDSDYD